MSESCRRRRDEGYEARGDEDALANEKNLRQGV